MARKKKGHWAKDLAAGAIIGAGAAADDAADLARNRRTADWPSEEFPEMTYRDWVQAGKPKNQKELERKRGPRSNVKVSDQTNASLGYPPTIK